MIRRPPRAKPTYTLCPDATLFRGGRKDGSRACAACSRCQGPRKKQRRRGINGGRADLLGRGRAQVPRKLKGGSGPPPSAGRFEQGEPAGRLSIVVVALVVVAGPHFLGPFGDGRAHVCNPHNNAK